MLPSGDVSALNGKSNCICSDFHGLESYSSGEASVRYQVVAPLPESVAFVDVGISGQVIGHVKVEDGVMTPEVAPNEAPQGRAQNRRVSVVFAPAAGTK